MWGYNLMMKICLNTNVLCPVLSKENKQTKNSGIYSTQINKKKTKMMITCIVLCDCVDSVSERWITEYIFTSKLSAENPQRGSSSQQWTLREVESACAWHMPLVSSFVIVVSARPPQLPSHHRFSLWHTTTFWPLADSHLLAPTFSLAALLFLPLGRSLTVVVCA